MTTCADIIEKSAAKFGTSGVRGLVEELDDATCFAYTLAFLSHLRNSHGLPDGSNVWVAMDLRPSSPRIAAACISAVEQAGCRAVWCGVLPTPALAFSALQDSAPAIMITGSHIPFDRNGIKFYRSDGEMLKEDEVPILCSLAEYPAGNFDGRSIKNNEIELEVESKSEEKWHQRYRYAFGGVLEGMRIGHYQHSAAGRDLLSQILADLGAEVVPIKRSESFIPIDTEAVSAEDTIEAEEWASYYELDAIVSTDGDGDRPLLGDETGDYLRGDTLGILAAHALAADHVVTPVSSNTALEKCGWFDAITRTKIGSPHVIAAMQKAADGDASKIVGFEANGGFLTNSVLNSPWNGEAIDALPTRDSVLPILSVLALARKKHLKLSQLSALLPSRATVSDRLVGVDRDHSMRLVELLSTDQGKARCLTASNLDVDSFNNTDGLRVTYSNGDIVHIRPSGNAPELRIYCESGSVNDAQDLLAHAREQLALMIEQ
ncbi:MAG: phosphomannomutase [Rhizobiaceae bacterium]